MERKSTFSRGEIVQINMYQRAWRSFEKKYPLIDFAAMVERVRIETDSDSINDIQVRDWMNLNIEMKQVINESLPKKRVEIDPELEERNKRAWLEEIRRTTPRNHYGFGLD